jgi:hypothetical protein
MPHLSESMEAADILACTILHGLETHAVNASSTESAFACGLREAPKSTWPDAALHQQEEADVSERLSIGADGLQLGTSASPSLCHAQQPCRSEPGS